MAPSSSASNRQPVPSEVPKWNSGRRESRFWHQEVQKFEAEQKKLQRSEMRLRRRFGTHWPKGVLDCFVERETVARCTYDRLVLEEEGRFDDWFPTSIVTAIDDALTHVDVENAPLLLEGLWDAIHRLTSCREDARRGLPVLTARQIRHLKKAEDACTRLNLACGADWPDIEAMQRLIGNWAEGGGLLHGLTLKGVVEAVIALRMEVSSRLYDRSTVRHRKPDTAMVHFCLDVAVALVKAGEPLKVHRSSSFARVLTILLQAAGERAPRNLVRRMAVAAKWCDSAIEKRERIARKWFAFESEAP
jgi:hypothetical protein